MLNDDAGWSWFQGARSVVHGERILASTVACGRGNASRAGNVEVSTFHLATRTRQVHVLGRLRPDDHNAAALLVRRDGRYLAVWADHHVDHLTRYRVSRRPGDSSAWVPERTFDQGARVTYANLVHLADEGRTYLFSRAHRFDPAVLVSDDDGDTWSAAGRLLTDPRDHPSQRPYVKYASDGRRRIVFIATDGHPNRLDTSVFAGYVERGAIHRMDGTVVGRIAAMRSRPARVDELTPVFRTQGAGTAGHRTHAWTVDLALGVEGTPYALFTTRVQPDENAIARGAANDGTSDHRFQYARWNGDAWDVHEVAEAGGGLYPGEDDYTGLAAVDPVEPATLFVSTPIDPRTGTRLGNHAIFRGLTPDGGRNWTWAPISRDPAVAHLRPVVPHWAGERRAVLWLRGRYISYTDYSLELVAVLDRRVAAG